MNHLANMVGVLAVAGTLAMPAAACSPAARPPLPLPISIKPDCSFTEAGAGRWEVGVGDAAVAIGGQKIGQKLGFGGSGCSVEEYLLFVDCGTGESVMLHGELPDGDVRIAGAFYTYISLIQPPHGPIGLTASSSVSELIEAADAHEIEYTQDVTGFVRDLRVLDRFNPYCGCKVFYPPDSKGGAELRWNGK